MRKTIFLFLIAIVPINSIGQELEQPLTKEIVVISVNTGEPLVGASIRIDSDTYFTDENGKLKVSVETDASFIDVSFVGFHNKRIYIKDLLDNPKIELNEYDTFLDDVIISTGYYSLPKERSTGSFTVVDKSVLNRSLDSDILSKLEGVTSSLHLDRRFERTEWRTGEPDLRVRGLSTINSQTKPLIVLNNFPYDGDLDQINPEDIENVIISKDAAAASIWGARASNGVIVITTKKGQFKQKPNISLNTSLTLGEKSNLFYDPNYLNSFETIEVEKTLFNRGYYIESDYAPLSPVIELLIAERENEISISDLKTELGILERQDVRREALKYMYRNSSVQQYSLGINGGSYFVNYYFSASYDKALESTINNNNNRITLNTDNTFKLSSKIGLNTNISFSQQVRENNGLGLYTSNAANRTFYYPYAQFKQNDINLPILGLYRSKYVDEAENNGLLNWQFVPLDEVGLNDKTNRQRYLNLSSQLFIELLPELKFSALYNYQLSGNRDDELNHDQSYYTRNLVNRFTQNDGTRVFPEGHVYFFQSNEKKEQTGRTQLNYDKLLGSKSVINILAGAEIREVKFNSGPKMQLLGYNPEMILFNNALDYSTRHSTKPYGTLSALPPPPNVMEDLTDRFISYYSNASFSFDRRFVFTGSARWDASNLFGVNINQKGVPLWSLGARWHLTNEKFYTSSFLPQLALRLTHGINGNINNSITAFPAIRYLFNSQLQVNTAALINPGNPNLKWEKTIMTNMGIDFGFKNNRVNGSMDFYIKKNKDLLGDDILDPTVGISTLGGANLTYLINYADLITKGFDLDLNSRNLIGKLRWNTNLIVNYSANKIIRYNSKDSPSIFPYFQSNIAPPKEGVSRDIIYSIPWHGLDPKDGFQFVEIDGELSKDYPAYISSLKYDEILKSGSAVPPLTGSLNNLFSYKNFDLSFNIIWKTGYFFRRSSIVYQTLFSSLIGHRDFLDRWQKEGDELITDVPAFPNGNSTSQDNVYRYSEVLVEKGDHVRLHNIQLGYRFGSNSNNGLYRNLLIQLYAKNLGLLWSANKEGLDPDYPIANYTPAKTIGVGLKMNF